MIFVCGFIATQGTLSPVIPLAYGIMVCVRGLLQGTESPVIPLAYGIDVYARIRLGTGSISVLRSIVPVCRDGMTSRNSFLISPKTLSLILTYRSGC